MEKENCGSIIHLSDLHYTSIDVRFKIHYQDIIAVIIKHSTTFLSLQTQQDNAAEPEVVDLSMSVREMDILDLLDVSFGPLSTTLPSSPESVCDSGSGSGSSHGDSPGGWAEISGLSMNQRSWNFLKDAASVAVQ